MLSSTTLATPITFALTLSLLTACGDGDDAPVASGNGNGGAVRMEISGSVGDGPIVGATIAFEDANGNGYRFATSDDNATYQTSLTLNKSQYPLIITAVGGRDLVTDGAPDFTLYSVVVNPSQQRISNINPHSTLITRAAQNLAGGINSENLASAQETVLRLFAFGLDPRVVVDPIESQITAANAANTSKSSEVLGEMIRRTRDTLVVAGMRVTGDDVVDAIAADLIDGQLDGLGAAQADKRIAAIVSFISGQVLLEAAANRLMVNNAVATSAMDAAIEATRPGAIIFTGDVVITAAMLEQIKALANSAASISPSLALTNIIDQLALLSGDQPPGEFIDLFPVEVSGGFANIIQQATQATGPDLDAMNSAVNLRASPKEPGYFEFSAANYLAGEAEGAVEITINRVDGSDGAVTVDWMTQGATATFAQDYGNFNWTPLTFADGETSRTETISIVNDDVVESDETFNVLLGNPTGGASLGTPATTTVTIANDDSAPPSSLSVVSTSPTSQAYGVQLSRNITIEFSSDLDCQGVSSQTISITNTSGNLPVSLACAGPTITINPTENFTPSTTYTITVLSNIASDSGVSMDGNYSWTFTTLAGSALPLLEEWESKMLTDGEHWGQYITNLYPAPGTYNEQSMTYYDGQRVFYQIADYTGQQEPWNTYALEAKRVYLNYAENSVNNSRGYNFSFPGYRRFAQGIYMDYVRTGDASVYENIAKIRDNPAISEAGSRSISIPAWYRERRSREVAYALEAHIFAERAGYPRDEADVARYVTMALTHIKEWVTGEFGYPASYRRAPFMFALTAEALITFYEWELENGRDPTALYNHASVPTEFIPTMMIPEAIKSMADYLYDDAVVISGDNIGKSMWVTDIGGRRPNWNDEGGTGYSTFRYEDIGRGAPTIDLNLMIAPAYAWLFQHYSEMKYINIADKLFVSGVSLSNTRWNTKIFNQNYRWSFDYIKWRNEGFAKIEGGGDKDFHLNAKTHF